MPLLPRPKSVTCQVLLACACAIVGLPAAQGSVTQGRANEQRMLDDARDGSLDEFSFEEAAFLANAVYDAAQRDDLQQRLQEWIAEFRSAVSDEQDPVARAAVIYELMHARILTGEYHSDCTQLARSLSDGHYNCVSATILFHMLGRAYDLDLVAVATPTHVYSRIHAGSQIVDVQTTCPQWFQLSSEQQRRHVPPGTSATANDLPREINDVQLLAKVYYNRGVRRLEAQQFEQAEAAFRISLQLDAADETARENLLAAINNWALDCSDDDEFAQAAELLERGRRIDTNYGAFLANDLHIHQRWAQQLCAEGRYAKALSLLENGRLRQPDAPLFREGPIAVYRMWALALAEQGNAVASISVLDEGLRHYPDARDLVADRARLAADGQLREVSSPLGDSSASAGD